MTLPTDNSSSNFILDLMNAQAKSQQTTDDQQIADQQTAQNGIHSETEIYGYWNGVLANEFNSSGWSGAWQDRYNWWMNLTGDSDFSAKCADDDMKDNGNDAKLQAQVNLDETKAQSKEAQADAVTTTAQSTASGDGSNERMLSQMTYGLTQISGVLSQMLGQV